MQIPAGITSSTGGKGDVFFKCEHCGIPLVVDRAAAGMTLNCERCGKPTTVPRSSRDSSDAAQAGSQERLAELRRHLKENESQRTEVKGYINQLSIQLHRWQLRLQALDDRNKQLKSEISALQAEDGDQSLG